MKTIVSWLILCSISFSCRKDKIPVTVENINISQGNEYLKYLGARQIEGGFLISKQANHFQVSEIQYDSTGGKYKYVPEQGFKGTDIVDLKETMSSAGTSNARQYIFRLVFSVND